MDVTFFEDKPYFNTPHLQGGTSREDSDSTFGWLLNDFLPNALNNNNEPENGKDILHDVSNNGNRDCSSVPLENQTQEGIEMCARQGGIEFKGKVYKRKYPRQEDRAPHPKQSQEPELMTDPENETQSGNSLSEPQKNCV